MLNLGRRRLFCQEQSPHQSLKDVNLLEKMETPIGARGQGQPEVA
jgi:hypothetical protein